MTSIGPPGEGERFFYQLQRGDSVAEPTLYSINMEYLRLLERRFYLTGKSPPMGLGGGIG